MNATTAPSLRRQILGALRWRTVMAVAGGAGGFLTTAFAARLVGPPDFTGFLLSASLIAVVPTLVRAGFGGSALLRVTTAEANGDGAGARATGWNLFNGALCVAPLVAVVASCALVIGRSTISLATVALLAAVLLAESIRLVASDLLLSLHQQRAAALTGFELRAALTTPIFLTLVLLDVSLGLIGVLGAILFVTAPLTALGIRRLISELGPRPAQHARLRTHLPFAGPFVLLAFANYAVARGDLWFASAGLSPPDAAVYGAASTLAAQLLLPLAIAGQAMAPFISHLWAVGRKDELERFLRKSAAATAIVSGAGGFVVMIAGRPLLDLIYGNGYGEGAVPFAILSAGAVLVAAGGATGQTLALCAGPAVAATVVTGAASITILFLGLGAWAGSALAMAAASSAGVVLSYGVQVAVVRRRLGMWTLPALPLSGGKAATRITAVPECEVL